MGTSIAQAVAGAQDEPGRDRHHVQNDLVLRDEGVREHERQV
jgi:hypothetical protein